MLNNHLVVFFPPIIFNPFLLPKLPAVPIIPELPVIFF